MKKTLLVLAIVGPTSAASAQISMRGSGNTSGGATVQTPSASGSAGMSGSAGVKTNLGKGGASAGTNTDAGAKAGGSKGGTSGGAELGATIDGTAKTRTRQICRFVATKPPASKGGRGIVASRTLCQERGQVGICRISSDLRSAVTWTRPVSIVSRSRTPVS